MKETMGQVIRRLRKERDLTQEELAEQLGVTFQAVSKWENDTGMPDISQVVPLATAFGVSADVLFGIAGANNAEEVLKIARHAYSHVTSPSTRESIKKWYDELQTGLKTYPTSALLLSQSLEAGISLAYPENDVFDAENGEAIYKECIRQANLLIKYSENTTDVLRAHMIMVLLHAAYGNFEMANNHANAFPWRADMTVHKMKAYIAHFERDHQKENKHRQNDFLYHFESMLDIFVDIGCCYHQLEEYEKAAYAFLQALTIIALIGKDEEVIPRFHCRERGDIYSLLAEVYVKQDRLDDALSMLEKMTDYDTKVLPQFVSGKKMQTPLLCDCEHNVYWSSGAYKENLLHKLHNPAFAVLKEKAEFQRLLKKISDL